MGWNPFAPKYPTSDTPGTQTPQRKTSRSERRTPQAQTSQVDHSTITEADLRNAERNGWKVDRRSRHVVIERQTPTGGTEMRSFTVLGNGRYGKR